MESLYLHTQHPLVLRTDTAPEGTLAALLRDGRVLAGRVAERLANGAILLSIGNHRVPAESRVPLAVGESFLFRVEHGSAGIVLRLVGGEVPAEPGLLAALRQVVGQDRPIGDLLANLAAEIRGRLAHGPGADERGRLDTLLAKLGSHLVGPDTTGDALAGLLRRSGLGYEAALLGAAGHQLSPQDSARLAEDLKGQLLRALSRLAEGPVREALTRTLAGLEAEQLLNLARSETGEPQHLSLPFAADAETGATTTLHLFVERREEEDGEDGPGGEPGQRLALEVDFSALGPVRVELWMKEGRLAARFLVRDEELAMHLRSRFDDLSERLAAGGAAAFLTASVAGPEELRAGERSADIAFLREQHLMDLEG